jgi:anti-sigma factor RsiW
MTQVQCTYTGDREQALIAFLYDDRGDAAARRAFSSHVATCARCAEELAEFRGVRARLDAWAPPEPHSLTGSPAPGIYNPRPWWRQVPAWAQVAAALLFLGVSAGIANLDIKYDGAGLSVRTGWSRPEPVAASVAVQRDPQPWRSDLAALEQQMRTELRAVQTSAAVAAPRSQPARVAVADETDIVRRVRALLDESEKRQQSELALRVAEVVRDVQAQRQADLIKIERTLGAVENRVGVEVMRDRQRLNTLLVRTGSR